MSGPRGELELLEAQLADPYDGLDPVVFGGWRPVSHLLWVHQRELASQNDDLLKATRRLFDNGA